MKKAAVVIVALATFALGTMILVGYVKGADERAVSNEALVDVMVVSQPIAAGEDPRGSLRTESMPLRLVNDDAVLPVDTLNDLVAQVDLVPGEQLLWTRLGEDEPFSVEVEEQTRVEIPDGFLAVTIPLDAERAIGGLIVPGMRVALLGSFTIEFDPLGEAFARERVQATNILVHKALVVEVQAEEPLENESPAALIAAAVPQGKFMVTLAVPAPDIERIVFAAEWGNIWLAQEDESADSSGSQIQTAATIFDKPELLGFEELEGSFSLSPPEQLTFSEDDETPDEPIPAPEDDNADEPDEEPDEEE